MLFYCLEITQFVIFCHSRRNRLKQNTHYFLSDFSSDHIQLFSFPVACFMSPRQPTFFFPSKCVRIKFGKNCFFHIITVLLLQATTIIHQSFLLCDIQVLPSILKALHTGFTHRGSHLPWFFKSLLLFPTPTQIVL